MVDWPDLHSEKGDNKYKVRKINEPIFRAQFETYKYYQKKIDEFEGNV